jgi:glycosyltransferase involved in cell wall biosynthesis
MKKLLYVCEADSGGIMEYAIRQSAAIAREGVEVHFLCKPSFPVERLEAGIKVWEFDKSRESRGERRGPAGKIFRVWRMIYDLWNEVRQVAQWAEELARDSSTRHPLLVTRYNLGEAEIAVLFACYKEYFAPFWVWPLRRLEKRGIVIGTIAHDPVRDFVVGPLWWHRWSVRLAYSFVRHVFVHDDTPVDFGGKQPEGIEVHQFPHGPYEVAEPKIGREAMRRKLGFATTKDTNAHEKVKTELTTEFTTERLGGREMEQPKVGPKGEGVGTTESKSTKVEAGPCLDKPSCASESGSLASGLADSPVSESLNRSAIGPASLLDTSNSLPATPASPDIIFLAFGQIRDGKNLDLFLWAMPRLPANVKLLVAGKGDSGSSRPAEYYQNLAQELGVAARCRWDIRRIPEDEVGDIFAACDVVLVTYSANFRSASGVLNAAVSARKLVMASSGLGPLKTVVEKYHLGGFIEPDNPEEVLTGSKQLMDALAAPAFSCHSVDTPTPLEPAWERYERENSWEVNGKVIVQNLG